MAGYTGQMTLTFWSEANSPEEVEARLNNMLDQWNLATSDEIHWDDVDWNITEETN